MSKKLQIKNSKGKITDTAMRVFVLLTVVGWVFVATISLAAEPTKVLIAHGAAADSE